MEISNIYRESLQSVQAALGMATLRKAMNQDSQTVSLLLEGMPNVSANVMENSVTPYKGANIDIRV